MKDPLFKFMRRTVVIMMLSLFALCALTGCNAKTTAAQQASLQSAASAATAQAKAFMVIAPQIQAADPADQVNIARFVTAYKSGLNAQAAGISNLAHVASTGASLSQNAKDSIVAEAQNATARAREIAAIAPLISQPPPVVAYLAAESAAENDLANALTALSALYVTKPPATAAPVTVQVSAK